jgi:3-oxoacyl-[acyl-carrier protein] reductase
MAMLATQLEGKVALITGGGAGIGRGIAEAYAELGAHVVIAEINPAHAEDVRVALAGLDHEPLIITADVQEKSDVDNVIAQIDQKFGRLDILINNVGDFLGWHSKFERFTEQQWDDLYNINLRHIFVVTQAALPLMRRSGKGGSIINISSIEGFRGIPACAVYAAFKAGIAGFTKSLALELGQDNIRVNAIAPETTETPQVPIGGLIPPEHQEHIKRWIPLGRFGTPQDAAGCAVFLATDLSAWVTGTTIHLDGGALAAGGFYRTPDGYWTNLPVVTDRGIKPPKRKK